MTCIFEAQILHINKNNDKVSENFSVYNHLVTSYPENGSQLTATTLYTLYCTYISRSTVDTHPAFKHNRLPLPRSLILMCSARTKLLLLLNIVFHFQQLKLKSIEKDQTTEYKHGNSKNK